METDLKGKTSERAEKVDLVELLDSLWYCQSLSHPYVTG